MQVKETPEETRSAVRKARQQGAICGVVPTMGALHRGHTSLMDVARTECDFVTTTIFVNPTQFGPGEDFERYPRTLQTDLEMCEAAGVDLVFTPQTDAMYASGADSTVSVNHLTSSLEGDRRPGHFDGVTTIVAKLFNITDPDKAYFGQKDFQQQLVIKRMVKDLDWGIDVVTCPIIREDDGLALSSRNRYLSAVDRNRALVLYGTLMMAQRMADNAAAPAEIAAKMKQMIETQEGVKLDYATVVNSETLEPLNNAADTGVALLAARVGQTRLIDNHILTFR